MSWGEVWVRWWSEGAAEPPAFARRSRTRTPRKDFKAVPLISDQSVIFQLDETTLYLAKDFDAPRPCLVGVTRGCAPQAGKSASSKRAKRIYPVA